MTPQDFLEAARVPSTLQPQTFGPWTIQRLKASESILGELGWLGSWPDYTLLRRVTESTIHLEPGEVVMEDSRRELSRHLPIWLAAHGRVLITGLGLGCVVRGLLASPQVEHIDVVEIDSGIIRVIGPEFAGNPRVVLHHGDALKFEWPKRTRWDFAWHDIWCEGDGLDRLHTKLLVRYYKNVGRQGAWQLPRLAHRKVHGLLGGPRR